MGQKEILNYKIVYKVCINGEEAGYIASKIAMEREIDKRKGKAVKLSLSLLFVSYPLGEFGECGLFAIHKDSHAVNLAGQIDTADEATKVTKSSPIESPSSQPGTP